jgi:hypothetical protein
LIILDAEAPAQECVLRWLDGDAWEKRMVLKQLSRVSDFGKLSFALKKIEIIAKSEETDMKADHVASDLLKRKP